MGGATLAFLYRYWNWIAPPLMAAALVALGFLIQGVRAVVKRSFLFRVPLEKEQEIRFDQPGPVALAIEAPLGSTRFARVSFDLTGPGGEDVPGRPVVFRTQTTGLSRTRLELMRFDLPSAGRYLLRMNGLGEPREKDAAHGVVFTHPHRARIVAHVVGMVVASAVLIVSLVFFVLRLGAADPRT